MKIMVAYDVEDPNPKLLDVARDYATAFNADVSVVAVLPGSERTRSRLEEEAITAMKSIRIFFEKEKVPCDTLYEFSGHLPGEKLIELAKKNNVDQIIIGIRMKSKFEKLVFGSTAQFVILKSPCPVVSVQ
jgi:nucleotide-binding universal stress UspA family protein